MSHTGTSFRRGVLTLIALAFVAAPSRADDATLAEDRAVENLAAFARVCGYVRFFHPSEQATWVDWEKLQILGAQAVRGAGDRETLRATLLQVFRPIAPDMRLTEAAPPTPPVESPARPDAAQRWTFWQYAGINLDSQAGQYSQRRVLTGETQGARAPLFEPAAPPAALTKTIVPGIVLHLPLALPVTAEGKTAGTRAPELGALLLDVANLDLATVAQTDWRLRVAGVTTVWNVFQHFHPYLDGIGVKWDETLEPALRRALRDQDSDGYYATLSELVAKTHDGHGYVYPGVAPAVGGLGIRVAVVEERVVVTGVTEGVPFRKGDVLERLDGMAALDVLRERERYASGSPHLRRFRALNQFGDGPVGAVAQVDVVRDGAAHRVKFARVPSGGNFFFNSIGEFDRPAFSEVRPGIFYVRISALDGATFDANLPQLAEARGVIFDWRRAGISPGPRPSRPIQPSSDVIPHLIVERIQASPMLVPLVTRPDRAGWTYKESTWPVEPKAPRLKGKVVCINDPSVVSYGETCMAMIADHRLATLVGAPTAGCNGNANYIPLPGGYRVMWTGMEVLKHDRSPFYTIGFVPDFPVERTIRGVTEGRDEYLEKAIEVVEAAAR